MQQNGHRAGDSPPARSLASLRSSAFEWSRAAALSPWLWVVLGALIAAPFPMFGWPLPERAAPIFFLLVAGILWSLGRISAASWPFALLILWAGVRAGYQDFPIRAQGLLVLLLMGGFLYALAREMPDRIARAVVWALLVSVGWEVLLGAFNAFGVYPFMKWVSAEHIGKPMGFLTHPNYWGSLVALALPLVWSRVGWIGVAVCWLLLLKTVSGGPVISAAVGSVVMAWPLFGRRVRLAVAGIGAAGIALTMTLHEWRLSGRSEVWSKSLDELLKPAADGFSAKWAVIGQGLGGWRIWADGWNAAYHRPEQGKTFFITLQAHNEPLQLWFELGVVGLAIAGLWALQAFCACRSIWRAAPNALIPSPWYGWGRAPLERAWPAVLAVAAVNMLGSPVFHLPGQAAIIVFALARAQADAAALTEPIPVTARAPKRQRAQKETVNVASAR